MDVMLSVVQTNEFWHAIEALLAVAALFVPNSYPLKVSKNFIFFLV